MASFGISVSYNIAWLILLLVSISFTLELKSRKENGTRISVINKYRIQRRLSPPEFQYDFDYNSRESDEKSLKPKRKVIYRLSNKKKLKMPSKASILKAELINKALLEAIANNKDNNLSGSTKKESSNLLGLSSGELNEIRVNQKRKGNWGLPFPGKDDDDDDDASNDETPVYSIDPAHPAFAAISHNPLAPYNPISHYPGLPPAPAPLKKKKKKGMTQTLFPLDRTYLTLGIVSGWIFWLGTFLAYYFWGEDSKRKVNLELFGDLSHQSKSDQGIQPYPQKPIIVKIEPGKPPQFYQTARALGGTSSFNFARVLDMIAIAQETYEKFDFQSLDCQKKALCELQQKQSEFGETGRKISSTFSFMDALEGLPVPTIIQTYLKEYKEAILQGKNSTKECASIYPKCGFSIKEVFVKYSKKTKLN